MAARVFPPLYLVTDRHLLKGWDLKGVLEEALTHGKAMVQLREKDLGTRALLGLARDIISVTQRFHVPLLINDRVDVVLATEADGVHLRSDSMPVHLVRQLLGPEKLVGFSAHSVEDVIRGEAEGANFAVLGPIYDTPSKRQYGNPIGIDVLAEASRRCQIPIFGIGGINAERVQEIKNAGAFGVAVISAVLGSDNVPVAMEGLHRRVRLSMVNNE